jgi:hypothetical protein
MRNFKCWEVHENKLAAPFIDIGTTQHKQASYFASYPWKQLCKHVCKHHPQSSLIVVRARSQRSRVNTLVYFAEPGSPQPSHHGRGIGVWHPSQMQIDFVQQSQQYPYSNRYDNYHDYIRVSAGNCVLRTYLPMASANCLARRLVSTLEFSVPM